MKQLSQTLLVAAVAALGLGMTSLTASEARADTYNIDPVHSMALFNVKHLGVGSFWGYIPQVEGSFEWKKDDPTASSINIKVKADSIFTADRKRDEHLKSPDFFNAKQFPELTFKSTSIKKTRGDKFTVEGELTVRGKTKKVTAEAEMIGAGKDPWGGMRAGFEARLTVKRSEFGVSFMEGGLGEEVKLIISVEGVKK